MIIVDCTILSQAIREGGAWCWALASKLLAFAACAALVAKLVLNLATTILFSVSESNSELLGLLRVMRVCSILSHRRHLSMQRTPLVPRSHSIPPPQRTRGQPSPPFAGQLVGALCVPRVTILWPFSPHSRLLPATRMTVCCKPLLPDQFGERTSRRR